MDFQMMCETIARKVFQCGRYDDPLGRLANTDSWSGLLRNEFSIVHKFKAWAIIARLKNQYLDSVSSREIMYSQADEIESRIINATNNQIIIDCMMEINDMVDELNLSEFPHISYAQTNDKNRMQ